MTVPASMPASGPGVLDERTADIARLADTAWDVVIVGGGIVGAGALLDAASRGLSAALIEQDDLAVGTSSRSSRLIHGGLRYLEQFHLPLVREALAERRRLLQNAPNLVTLVPLLFPIYGLPVAHKLFYDAGLTVYDLLGARHDGGWHRRLDVGETLGVVPALRQRGLRGGLLYHDGMEDDARFVVAVVRTALAANDGTLVLTRMRATGILPGVVGDDLRVLRVEDRLGGQDLDVRSRAIVDATGVWAADPAHPFVPDTPAMSILPSRGAHLVVPRERIPATAGVTIRVPGKVVFLVPWPDHWLIGTTDAPYEGEADRPSASAAEVDELIATVNDKLDVDLSRDDVVGTYAGLRPLIAPTHGSTVKASREHRITREASGVIRVGGGKYTTYRVMARDVIDAALGREAATARPSGTADHRLIGAIDGPDRDRLVAELEAVPDVAAAHPDAAARLVARHGVLAPAVVAFGRERSLLGPLVAGRPFLEAEVAWAVHEELALSVDDVLSRRLRLSTELADRRQAVAARVATIMARELDWSDEYCRQELASYLRTAAREYSVPAD